MNVTDLRKSLRRSGLNVNSAAQQLNDRRKGERRSLMAQPRPNADKSQRIWLTPGEKALIEDLYLLED